MLVYYVILQLLAFCKSIRMGGIAKNNFLKWGTPPSCPPSCPHTWENMLPNLMLAKFHITFFAKFQCHWKWPSAYLEMSILYTSSASDKAKLFSENFSMNSNLDDSVMSLLAFPSRTNLKLHNMYVTPKMVRKVVMNLDLPKTSGPDCIPVVVLKNCEPKLSYILAGLFNRFLSLVFHIAGRFHQWCLYLRMLGKGLQLKTVVLLVFFLWSVKSLKNL